MFDNYIFDLYGTLIDINTDESKKDLWKKLALLYSYKKAYYTSCEIQEKYIEYVKEEKARVQKRNPEIKTADIKIERVLKKLFTAKGVKVTPKEIDFICTSFRCYSTIYIKLYEGVLELLSALKSKGKKVYLLSNAQRKFTENELNMFNLTDYFDGILISSDEQCSKPDKMFFNKLLEKYNIDVAKSVMIGNDSVSDILGAYNVGLKSFYIHQSISPPIEGELMADFSVMDGDFSKIKDLILR